MSNGLKLLYRCHAFHQLTIDRLYQILKIRQEVFVVEQECAYLDCDDHDQSAFHLCGIDQKAEIISYSRIIPPDMLYDDFASLGRILVRSSARGKGLGREITAESIERVKQLFGEVPIKIMAQTYLIHFYETFGFEIKGEPFMEDGIEHQYMTRR